MRAAIFPGQGSQSVGMGKFLFDEFKIAKEIFEEASDALSQDLRKLCFDGPESDLMLTENTQPAILLSSYVTYRVLGELVDLKITSSAGHSIGEYAAFVSSGAMSFAEGMKAVKTRGQEMQKAVPAGKGGMAALMGATEVQAEEVCSLVLEKNPKGGVISPANFNAPGQIVLSGSAEQIDYVSKNITASMLSDPPKRLKFIPLKVSAPFHCELMQPAEVAMRSVIEGMELNDPSYGVVQNFDGSEHKDLGKLRENLIRQISGPVLWVKCVETLKASGHGQFIEFGNGKVLAGLLKKIDPSLEVININSLDDLKAAETKLS